MADRKKRFRIGLVVLVAISLFVCPLAAGGFGLGGANAQIAFTPNVSTLVLTQTVEGPELELGATVEPEATPIMHPTFDTNRIVSTEEGGFYTPTYARVECGPSIEDDVCYELCYAGRCHVYGDDDDRVGIFVGRVEERRQRVEDLDTERDAARGRTVTAVGTCFGAAAGGFLVYTGVIAAADPEPATRTIATVLTAVGAAILCGGSAYTAYTQNTDRISDIEGDIHRLGQEAVGEFESLERNPPGQD
jgi:hypothetical protein